MMEEVPGINWGSVSQPIKAGKRATLRAFVRCNLHVTREEISRQPKILAIECASDKKTREAGDGEIGLEEFLRDVGGAENGFGGEITAADGTFHSGRPAGGGPVAGEEESGSFCFLRGTPAVDTWFR